MEQEFWMQRWEAGQVGFHQQQINPYLQKFWQFMSVPAEAKVFVPLSGKSLDMCWLRDQGHTVIGVELSPIAVADFFATLGVDPQCRQIGPFQRCGGDQLELWCGDFFDLDKSDLAAVGAVFDRASLVAMPPPMRPEYARHLSAILPAAAPILLVTMEYPEDQMQGPPFSVSDAEIQRLYGEHYRIEQLTEEDIIAQSPRFRDKGVSYLIEKAFVLRPD